MAELSRPSFWLERLQDADRAVEQHVEAGYTTLIAAGVSASHLVGASNGDSAAVLFQDGQDPLTLTSAQAKNPPVGSGFAEITPFGAQLGQSWRLLLMSDGVWKYAGWEAILRAGAKESGTSLIDRLSKAARLTGSGQFQDDFTIVVIQAERN